MTRGEPPPRAGSPREVLAAFARLGLTSFGGPAAHLGYFRAEFVERRRWLGDAEFSDLVALCQFLPGPASSQTGFAIGLIRAGRLGALAAWAGFTLPSAALMTLCAYAAGPVGGSAAGAALLHGLKLVAVAVVAQAVWGMARALCPDRARATVATGAAVLALAAPGPAVQLGAILLGGLAGLALGGRPEAGVRLPLAAPVSRRAGAACLLAFAVLLAVPPLLPGAVPAVFDAFYRAGALVFGGGHVVLPLLRDAVVAPGWVDDGAFLAGYGAAQAMPGPLFAFAAFLGASLAGPAGGSVSGVPGAALALAAIFLPGLLLLLGALPFWDALRSRPSARAVMRGVNAAVVGLLGAALYDPVWTGAVRAPADVAAALAGFVLLVAWRAPPLLVAGLGALCGLWLR